VFITLCTFPGAVHRMANVGRVSKGEPRESFHVVRISASPAGLEDARSTSPDAFGAPASERAGSSTDVTPSSEESAAGLGTASDERDRGAALPEDGGARLVAKREARPAGLEPAPPGLEGRITLWEATPLQQVARTATRMCHASDLPLVTCERCRTRRARTSISKHWATRQELSPAVQSRRWPRSIAG